MNRVDYSTSVVAAGCVSIAFLIVLVIALVISSCRGGSDNPAPYEETTAPAPPGPLPVTLETTQQPPAPLPPELPDSGPKGASE